MAVAATSTGDLLASASRATKPEHAVIRLWRTHSVNGSFLKHPKALYTLPITHALTVTALRFSHDDGMLLSVSRDRTWALYRRVEGGGGGGGVGGGGGDDDNGGSDSVNNNWELIKMHAKPHARIIWDCSWTSNDKFFATASRDKSVRRKILPPPPFAGPPRTKLISPSLFVKVKIWRVDTLECCLTLSFEESVTAIDFAPRHAHERETEICVVGLETGRLMVCEVQLDIALISSSTKQPCSVIRQTVLELDECPSMSVTAIRWRPNSTSLEFVCCSEDHSVRLYSAK